MTQHDREDVVIDVEHPPATRWTVEQSQLLKHWHAHASAAQHAHYLLASRYRRANLWIGIPAVVASTVVGTSLFASLAEANDEALIVSPTIRFLIGATSVIAAILAAVQTFLGFAKRAEQHVQAADWYSAIRRKIEETLSFRPDDRGDPKRVLDDVRSEMNRASQTYPEIGEDVWHSVGRRYGVQQPPYPEGPARRTARARGPQPTTADRS